MPVAERAAPRIRSSHDCAAAGAGALASAAVANTAANLALLCIGCSSHETPLSPPAGWFQTLVFKSIARLSGGTTNSSAAAVEERPLLRRGPVGWSPARPVPR